MGFSQLAVFLLLAGSTFYGASVLSERMIEAHEVVHQGWRSAEGRAEVQRQGALQVDSASWNKGSRQLTLGLSNTGSITLGIEDMEIVVDGQRRTQNIVSEQVEGVDTGIWAPASALTVVLDLSGHYAGNQEPSDVLVVTDEGLKAYWRA